MMRMVFVVIMIIMMMVIFMMMVVPSKILKTKMAMGGILMEILVTIVKQNVENQVPQIQVWESARVCCRMLITNNTPMFDLR